MIFRKFLFFLCCSMAMLNAKKAENIQTENGQIFLEYVLEHHHSTPIIAVSEKNNLDMKIAHLEARIIALEAALTNKQSADKKAND